MSSGRFRQLSQCEIEDLDPAVSEEKQVLWLQVTMHYPLIVRRSESARYLRRVLNRFPLRHRTPSQRGTQSLAFQQL